LIALISDGLSDPGINGREAVYGTVNILTRLGLPANISSRSVKDLLPALIRFGTFGSVTFGANIGLTAILHEGLGLAAEFAFAFSLGIVLIIGFVGCRYVIFEAASEGNAKHQAFLFLLSSFGFRGAEYLTFLLLHTLLGVYYLTAIVASLILSFFAKFFFYRHVVFVPIGVSGTSTIAQREE
jgi:putative flippase GtrA